MCSTRVDSNPTPDPRRSLWISLSTVSSFSFVRRFPAVFVHENSNTRVHAFTESASVVSRRYRHICHDKLQIKHARMYMHSA